MQWILCTVFFYLLGFFIALHSFPLYGWLGNLYIMVCLLVPIVLTYFMPLFWGLHFDTLCLYSLLSHLSTTENPYTEEIFLLPLPLIPVQLGNWDCCFICCEVMGWDIRCWSEYTLKILDGPVFCLLTYAEACVSLSGLLLTCTGSNAEMWEPVPQSGLC